MRIMNMKKTIIFISIMAPVVIMAAQEDWTAIQEAAHVKAALLMKGYEQDITTMLSKIRGNEREIEDFSLQLEQLHDKFTRDNKALELNYTHEKNDLLEKQRLKEEENTDYSKEIEKKKEKRDQLEKHIEVIAKGFESIEKSDLPELPTKKVERGRPESSIDYAQRQVAQVYFSAWNALYALQNIINQK